MAIAVAVHVDVAKCVQATGTYFKNVSSQPSFDCLEFKRDSEHSIIQLLNNEL